MTSKEQVRKDASSALLDAERLKTEIIEFAELRQIESQLIQIESPMTTELEEFRERVEELLDRVRGLLLSIKKEPLQMGSPGDVFPLSTLAQELKTQLEWLEGMLLHLENMVSSPVTKWPNGFAGSIRSSVSSALSKVKNYLIPLLKKFLSKLWSIISGLLTPKEWKIKGGVGTGLLGLANVEVEVTFGP